MIVADHLAEQLMRIIEPEGPASIGKPQEVQEESGRVLRRPGRGFDFNHSLQIEAAATFQISFQTIAYEKT